MLYKPYNNKKLIGLEDVKMSIFNDFLAGKLHHSIMITGNKGIGKATLSYHIANKILDNNSNLSHQVASGNFLFDDIIPDANDLQDDNPTYNLIKNQKHPDLLVIEKGYNSKESKEDKEIKVASAREIIDFISLSPYTSQNKVIIIDSIDEMNISAQNAILKTLEEPVKNTYIFLICHDKKNVLDTISSRCKEINIPNHNFDTWKEILTHSYASKKNTLTAEQLEKLYTLSNASISFAIDIIEEDGLFLFQQIGELLSNTELNIDNLHILADKLNNNITLYNLFSNFILLFLYLSLKALININSVDCYFKEQNRNFLLNNNEKQILEKIKFTQSTLQDIKTFNLSIKHAVVVLFTELYK